MKRSGNLEGTSKSDYIQLPLPGFAARLPEVVAGWEKIILSKGGGRYVIKAAKKRK